MKYGLILAVVAIAILGYKNYNLMEELEAAKPAA